MATVPTITPGMTAPERAAVYVTRLEAAAKRGPLTATQSAELARYREVAARGATATGGPGGTPTPVSAAPPVSYPTPAVAPGTLGTMGGLPAVQIGSTARNPGGTWVDLGAPSGDTFGLLQQLLAVEANPALLAGTPLASHPMFADPAQRRSTIGQIGASILASGPAYYGAYSGLSGDQIAAIGRAFQSVQNPAPGLAEAIAAAAKATPPGAPARAPYSPEVVAAAAKNLTLTPIGSYGTLATSAIPAGITPTYTSTAAPITSAPLTTLDPTPSPITPAGATTPLASPSLPFGAADSLAGPVSIGSDGGGGGSGGGGEAPVIPRGMSGPGGGPGVIDLALLALAAVSAFGLMAKRKGKR